RRKTGFILFQNLVALILLPDEYQIFLPSLTPHSHASRLESVEHPRQLFLVEILNFVECGKVFRDTLSQCCCISRGWQASREVFDQITESQLVGVVISRIF